MVYAIPNGISESFNPALIKSERQSDRIKVAISCRLEYRRGIDLLLGVIPKICKEFDNVDFLIIGDGPYRIKEGPKNFIIEFYKIKIAVDPNKLEELRERLVLDDRVDIRGMIPHSRVASVLSEADIFLNTALTEAFCIAIGKVSTRNYQGTRMELSKL